MELNRRSFFTQLIEILKVVGVCTHRLSPALLILPSMPKAAVSRCRPSGVFISVREDFMSMGGFTYKTGLVLLNSKARSRALVPSFNCHCCCAITIYGSCSCNIFLVFYF